MQPALVRQKIVDLVGKDQLLQQHLLLAQVLHQVNALVERHITVVVAMNDQHRRTPGLDMGDR
jgi:hypothetical protein